MTTPAISTLELGIDPQDPARQKYLTEVSNAAMAGYQPITEATRRDKRVDLIMMFEDLFKYLISPLRDGIKEKHALVEDLKKITLTGDIAEARIEFQDTTEINVEKFYKLFKADKITEKQFLSCLTVSKTDAKKLLGTNQVDAITEHVKTAQKMTISRIKGTSFDLKAAMTAAQEAVTKPADTAADAA